MSNKLFVVFALALISLGFLCGWSLANHPEIKHHKVLELIGSIYNLLAVIVLSEILTSAKNYKEIAIKYIAPAVLWIHTLVPLGSSIGAFFAFKAVGRETALKFSWAFFIYSCIPLSLLEATVVFPRLKIFSNRETRWRYFGLFLLLSGVLLQIIANIMDFGS